MSFAIAIANHNEFVIAADTKANSRSGAFQYQNIDKIYKVSEACAIAITGDFEIGKAIVERYAKFHNEALSTNSILILLSKCAETFDIAFTNRFGRHADCVFILAHQEQETSRIALLILDEGKAQIWKEPFQCEEYQYYFAPPTDVQFDLIQLSCLTLMRAGTHKNCKELAENLIRNVSHWSQYVNDVSSCIQIK